MSMSLTDQEFLDYLKEAHREVLTWPNWKQKLLGWNVDKIDKNNSMKDLGVTELNIKSHEEELFSGPQDNSNGISKIR